jgi:hypothetical protein
MLVAASLQEFRLLLPSPSFCIHPLSPSSDLLLSLFTPWPQPYSYNLSPSVSHSSLLLRHHVFSCSLVLPIPVPTHIRTGRVGPLERLPSSSSSARVKGSNHIFRDCCWRHDYLLHPLLPAGSLVIGTASHLHCIG